MKSPLSDVGFRIRTLRESRHQSQTSLAMECRRQGFEITRLKVAHYERGRCEVPARYIPVLAFVLKADVAALLPSFKGSTTAESVQSTLKDRNLAGRQIRAHRRKLGWTQDELANAVQKFGISMSRTSIANFETRRRAIKDYQSVLIARALGVPLTALFSDTSAGINVSSEIALQSTKVSNHEAPTYEDRKGNSKMVTGESWQALHSPVD
jgi:transcriptional regulator with XRE-family HTH domain